MAVFTHLANAKSTTAANADPAAWSFGDQYPDSDEENHSQDGAPMDDIVQGLKPVNNFGRTWCVLFLIDYAPLYSFRVC